MPSFISKSIPLSKLLLDEENPRFIIPPNATEQDIINYLLEYEEIEDLARSINNNRGLYAGERIIVIEIDGKYTVLEGNRRVSACKILYNLQLLYNYRPGSSIIVYPETLKNISSIDADILSSRTEAQSSLAAKHIDGIKKWSPISKNKFFAKEFILGKSLREIRMTTGSSNATIKKGIREYNLIQYALNLPEWTEKESGLIVDMNKLKISPFIRVFNAGTNISSITSLGKVLELQFDETTLQPHTSIPKEVFDHCIYLVAKSAFDKTIKFDTRSTMEDVIGLIEYMKTQDIFSSYFNHISQNTDTTKASSDSQKIDAQKQNVSPVQINSHPTTSVQTTKISSECKCIGGKGNLPYFFDGLKFDRLNPTDPLTHGLSRICYELKIFSERKYVKSCPIAAAFLTRAVIEHSLIYYAKTHNFQASNKKIWEYISPNGSTPKLSTIIDKYNGGLENYIPDVNIRQYFTNLFGSKIGATEPLNWVIHRPEDYAISPEELSTLPSKGLLAIINYLIS